MLRSGRFAEHSLVTSTVTAAPLLRVTVQPSTENGLHVVSQVMIDHTQSVRVQRIEHVIGQRADGDLKAITRALNGLSRNL